MLCNGIQRFYYARILVPASFSRQGSHMRAVLLILLAVTSWAGEAFGVWTLNPALSTRAGNEKSLTLRIEPHTHGEVFTLDTLASDGRASTFSTILYLDGLAREFQDPSCSGTQLSRRVDSQTVEILRECANGAQIRLVRRAVQPGVLILEITEQQMGGRRSERRLFMEKR
jgi:hypothetical protein